MHNQIEIEVRQKNIYIIHSPNNSEPMNPLFNFLSSSHFWRILNLFLLLFVYTSISYSSLFSAFFSRVSSSCSLFISCVLCPFLLDSSPFHFHPEAVITVVYGVKMSVWALHLCEHYTHWIQANIIFFSKMKNSVI